MHNLMVASVPMHSIRRTLHILIWRPCKFAAKALFTVIVIPFAIVVLLHWFVRPEGFYYDLH